MCLFLDVKTFAEIPSSISARFDSSWRRYASAGGARLRVRDCIHLIFHRFKTLVIKTVSTFYCVIRVKSHRIYPMDATAGCSDLTYWVQRHAAIWNFVLRLLLINQSNVILFLCCHGMIQIQKHRHLLSKSPKYLQWWIRCR